MNRFIISFLLGALLAVIIAGIFLQPPDDRKILITEWEQLGKAYNDGKITREEYRRGAEKLIKRSKNIPRKPCNRKWHTKPCGQP
ncbi:hypothetical protein C6495_05715 [Candidatus Poribacteria bacterium]|nr:MAG: hypothetical protein C6495_05715 [Candidatus Poribacteria bacterium]